MKKFRSYDLLLIDISIGLREQKKIERVCDKQARRILGQPRGLSVFTVPSRFAIYCNTYK
ncbi:MAG: DUF429 domain-containing protein [Firmicutes bacterium]|nr:DUF429 domain-containing protein [Bacillota bacterium]